jgi:hypothetical protein
MHLGVIRFCHCVSIFLREVCNNLRTTRKVRYLENYIVFEKGQFLPRSN